MIRNLAALVSDLTHYNRGVDRAKAAYYREIFRTCSNGHRLASGKAFCLACDRQTKGTGR